MILNMLMLSHIIIRTPLTGIKTKADGSEPHIKKYINLKINLSLYSKDHSNKNTFIGSHEKIRNHLTPIKLDSLTHTLDFLNHLFL